MKWTKVIFALTLVGMASCSSPTAPRLPQPEDDRPPPPDSPGVVGLRAPHAMAGRVRLA